MFAGYFPATEQVENLKISIRDNGIGISEEDQKKLFQKFFRVEDPEIQKKPGTGLGLWISNKLVEMHRGSSYVNSKLGEGTEIGFKLPLT